MNKIELINGVAIEAGISKAQAKVAVDAAIKVMTTALVKGDKIAVVGFGTLAVQESGDIQAQRRTRRKLETIISPILFFV